MASGDGYGEEQIMPGTQLDKIKTFKVRNDEEVKITAIMVDFSRLIQSKTSVDVVKGVSNRDLLHAAVALYDVSLSDMTPDVLYCSVCDKSARTVLLLRDIDGTLQDMEARHQKRMSTTSDSTSLSIENSSKPDQLVTEPASDTMSSDEADKTESDEDCFQPEENKPCTFADVFSDTEEEEEEEEDNEGDNEGEEAEEEEEEDFSKGMHSFLRNIANKRKRLSNQKTPLTRDDVGIENRLVAAMTFEKKFVKTSDTIVHLTLLAVRQRFRKCSIGKYLVQQLKTASVVGRFDAVVVHADNSAVPFFRKSGFSDDVILNKRWSELAEQYTHCTLMCSLPPFTRDHSISSSPELDLKAMAAEILKWRSKCVEAYQAEVSCMVRMQQEIIHLRAVVSSQQDLIEQLTAKNEQLQCEKFLAEKDFLKYRLQVQLGLELNCSDMDSDLDEEALNQVQKKTQLNHNCLPSDFNSSVKLFVLQSESEAKEIHLEDDKALEFQLIIHYFYESVSFEELEAKDYKITTVTKAVLPDSVSDVCSASVAAMSDPTIVTKLYFCGSCTDPRRILQTGFTDQDLIHGSFGTGLYFSKYPSRALRFSQSGKLIVAEVGLGNIRSVTTGDPEAVAPPTGYDSILTPGREASVSKDSKRHQEYVVYNIYQSRPLFLIECLSCQT